MSRDKKLKFHAKDLGDEHVLVQLRITSVWKQISGIQTPTEAIIATIIGYVDGQIAR